MPGAAERNPVGSSCDVWPGRADVSPGIWQALGGRVGEATVVEYTLLPQALRGAGVASAAGRLAVPLATRYLAFGGMSQWVFVVWVGWVVLDRMI